MRRASPPEQLHHASQLSIACLGVAVATLKRGCAHFVEKGNNLVFSESVHKVEGPEPQLGDNVVVCDYKRKIVGWGVFNPRSVYRIRMMQTMPECQEDTTAVLDVISVFRSRLLTAIELRTALGLPSSATNAFRVVHGDGDNLSGVNVDKFRDVVVVHSGVSWLELNRDAVIECLRSTMGVDTVVWRLRPVISDQEGIPNAIERIYTSRSDITLSSEIEIVENDLRFLIALAGQKTGFYTDQRENRFFLRGIVRGRRVLDLCCYTGGFALNAALGDAESVLGIDSSQPAIDLARRNADLNDLNQICRFECGDILNRLQVAAANGEEWDVVVLDPPKLAFSKLHLTKSLGRYRKLNRAAIKVVRRGGILMTCSCSGLINVDQFIKAVCEAAQQIGRRLTIVRIAGAAADHVISISHREGAYLKCLTVRVT